MLEGRFGCWLDNRMHRRDNHNLNKFPRCRKRLRLFEQLKRRLFQSHHLALLSRRFCRSLCSSLDIRGWSSQRQADAASTASRCALLVHALPKNLKVLTVGSTHLPCVSYLKSYVLLPMKRTSQVKRYGWCQCQHWMGVVRLA